MKHTPLRIPDVIVLEPNCYSDNRGIFFESFNRKVFEEIVQRPVDFVQDNHSLSYKNVLRGLHIQKQQPQGKLVRVVQGTVFDVAVDLRPDSPTYGEWVAETLSAENRKQLWIPEGFAHGILALSDTAEVSYKVSGFHIPGQDCCILWNDPDININWPTTDPILSTKDQNGLLLKSLQI